MILGKKSLTALFWLFSIFYQLFFVSSCGSIGYVNVISGLYYKPPTTELVA